LAREASFIGGVCQDSLAWRWQVDHNMQARQRGDVVQVSEVEVSALCSRAWHASPFGYGWIDEEELCYGVIYSSRPLYPLSCYTEVRRAVLLWHYPPCTPLSKPSCSPSSCSSYSSTFARLLTFAQAFLICLVVRCLQPLTLHFLHHLPFLSVGCCEYRIARPVCTPVGGPA